MIPSLLIHAALTWIWVLLIQKWTLGNFILGMFIGYGVIYSFPSLLKSETYIRKTRGLFKFAIKFTWTFLKANIGVAKIILFLPKNELNPGFFTYDISGMSKLEILVLSNCITLTPGTTSVDISADLTTLTVHALQFEHPDHIREEIKETLEKPLLEWTR